MSPRRLPAPKPARATPGTVAVPVAKGRSAPAPSLASAVAIACANAQVNAPVPPSVQAVLDADPEKTRAAIATLEARLAEAEPPAADDEAKAPNPDSAGDQSPAQKD